MKQQFKTQKWILSSLLIAALGSQYYFSANSKDLTVRVPAAAGSGADEAITIITNALSNASTNSVDIDPSLINITAAPTAPLSPDAASPARPTAAVTPAAARPATAAPAAAAPAAARPAVAAAPAAAAPAAATEAGTNAGDCIDCVRLKRAELERINATLKALVEAQAHPVVAAAAPAAAPAAAAASDETPSERRERLRQEKLDAKAEKALKDKEAKEEKAAVAADAQAERDENFSDKVNDLVGRYKDDPKGLLKAFAEELRNHRTKDTQISASAVKLAYATSMAEPLKSLMGDDVNASINAAFLEAFESSIPSNYSSVRIAVADTVKNSAVDAAATIKAGLAAAPGSTAFGNALTAKNRLNAVMPIYAESLNNAAQGDVTLTNYMKTNFSPAISGLFATTASTTTGTSTTSGVGTDGGRTFIRGGTTSISPSVQTQGSPVISGTNTTGFGNSGETLGGISFGSPGAAGASNGRTARGQ